MRMRGSCKAQIEILILEHFLFSTMLMHAQACVCWSKYTTADEKMGCNKSLRQQFV